ncbi:hypothetical protein CC1G_14044 [Coprinopsis cinerea okayama7|uniref:Uncharacterized protein n=1 Tax=Coprinopsis cinerea (strain Okayama-7 / 130 / ATCC MYA-4618 / FGSC 9003) TaxID=240176 RepID=D6RL20_COPC7|nr:hypothetical protein CC1G_14044 [Coprinopsis cinerea okayama7\|eukprot:XP_002912006.1 hypothetical protein CC1G_14044 [Coprinopsis cinerea okayama7\
MSLTRLIREAKAGNASALQELSGKVNQQNFTPSMLEASLNHLRLDLIPCTTSEQITFRLQYAIPLFRVCVIFYKPSVQGPKGVMMLLERLEGILTWFRVCMVYSTTFSTGRRLGAEVDFIAETVGLMVELDADLADLILRSKTTVEILLQAWSSRLTNDANPPSPFSTNQCPIIHLLAKFGDCEDGMEQLGASSRGRLASFGSGLLLRIAHTPVLTRNDMTTTRHVVSATSCHILPLLISSMNLVQFPQIHRYLRKAGLLYHVARAVKILQVCLTPADTYLVACYAIRLSYQSHANAVQGFTQVLEEGVLEVVIDAIIAHGGRPIVPRGSSFSPNMLLRALSAFSYFPRTLKALAEAIERIPAAKWARLERMKSPVYPEAWGERSAVGWVYGEYGGGGEGVWYYAVR